MFGNNAVLGVRSHSHLEAATAGQSCLARLVCQALATHLLHVESGRVLAVRGPEGAVSHASHFAQ